MDDIKKNKRMRKWITIDLIASSLFAFCYAPFRVFDASARYYLHQYAPLLAPNYNHRLRADLWELDITRLCLVLLVIAMVCSVCYLLPTITSGKDKNG